MNKKQPLAAKQRMKCFFIDEWQQRLELFYNGREFPALRLVSSAINLNNKISASDINLNRIAWE